MGFDIRDHIEEQPKNWKFVKISDVAYINAKSLKKNEAPENIFYLDISSVSTGTMESPKILKASEAPSRAKRIVFQGDILISTVRPNLRQYVMVTDEIQNLIASTGFCVVTPKNQKYAWFLYGVITSEIFTDYLIRIADGAAYPSFNPQAISESIILWPDEDTLFANNDFLKALNLKIKLNTKINQTLENIAQAIFKSWFVDFDPVKAKIAVLENGGTQEEAELVAMQKISAKSREELAQLAKQNPSEYQQLSETAALFPSKMQDSELGEIPGGWEVIKFGDLIMPKRGKSITKYKVKEGVIPVVAGGINPAYYHNAFNVTGPVITISASGANAGYINLYFENIWASDCSYISYDLTDFLFTIYCFLVLNQKKIFDMQQGAAQPHIYPSDIARLNIVIPDEIILMQLFENKINNIFKIIGGNKKNSSSLNHIKNLLLPKLISAI